MPFYQAILMLIGAAALVILLAALISLAYVGFLACLGEARAIEIEDDRDVSSWF